MAEQYTSVNFFRIFGANLELYHLNDKLRADQRIKTGQIGPSHNMECFLYFFENYYRKNNDKIDQVKNHQV